MSTFPRRQPTAVHYRQVLIAAEEDRSFSSDPDRCLCGVHLRSSAGVVIGSMNGNEKIML